jgi:aminoglycoside 3-N-acetyltransferase
MREFLTQFAVRHLDERRLLTLRAAYLAVRAQLNPAMQFFYGTFSAATLRTHLEERIGQDFEILMVHSSVNNLKPMFTGSPIDLVRMLIDFCGRTRTLVMPAFYFGDPNVGTVNDTFKRNPRFDLRRTASQMGIATELFRRWPGVLQSRHPVYRVSALGPLAAELTLGHEVASYGLAHSGPFEFMTTHETTILGIGKSIEVLTHAHHCEAVLGQKFPMPQEPGDSVAVTLVDGQDEVHVLLQSLGIAGRFNVLKLREIMPNSSLKEWTFHHVPIFTTRAADVTNNLLAAAERGVTLYERR